MRQLFSRFSKRERLLSIAVSAVIFMIAAYIFILEPFYSQWNRFGTELETANLKLLKNSKLLYSKEYLEGQYERYKDYLGKEGDQSEEIAAVLKEIEATALNCGVKITSIKPKGVKQLNGYKQFEVEFISEGKIEQFLKFMYDIENSKRLLKVERLVLSLKSSQQPDILKGTFQIYKISLTN